MDTDTPRVALIQFPGSNCEWETKRAAEAAGISCDVFRWNRDPKALLDYEGYIIGGGFSYQDRVRAGAIACKEPIMKTVFDEVTDDGKPVIGICNGAQVLVESGLVPGIEIGRVQMALAPNLSYPESRIAQFWCRWVFIKQVCDPQRCVFTGHFDRGEVIPIPIAHGEGRFTTADPETLEAMKANDQIVFQYSDVDGTVEDTHEINPNGAVENIAAVCNPEGNVLAVMPHPERASFLRQIPAEIGGPWSEKKMEAYGDADALNSPGPGMQVFDAMFEHLKSRVPV